MNMTKWFADLLAAERKGTMPILSFPSISLLGVSVRELISDSDLQARGMKAVADRCPSAASVSFMDLSVEAEAFGASVRFSDDEVPTVIGTLVADAGQAEALAVPAVGAARTGLYIDAIRKASALISDRPVFAGMIGPFSLAGRLFDVNEAFILCYEDPGTVHLVLDKVTRFLIEYAKAYKAAGANGIVMAEPLAGLLSADFCAEFSEPYVKRIIDAVKDDGFAVVYHNCGNNAIGEIESILRVGASAYHFGNAIDMEEMMSHIPPDTLAMGNIDPAGQFMNGTPESIREATRLLMWKCCHYPNFAISSGCDIPPLAPWANIDAYFKAVNEYYDETI